MSMTKPAGQYIKGVTSSWLFGITLLLIGIAGQGSAQDYKTDQAPLNAAVAGYSAGGLLSVVGEAVGAMVRAEYPGSSLLYEPGNPVGGLMKVAHGERPFAMLTAQDLKAGLLGLEPFREKVAPEDFRVVAKVVQGMVLQIVVRKDFLQKYQVKTMADIAAKKVPVRIGANQKGNLLGHFFAQGLLEANGLSYEAIESFGGKVFYVPNKDAGDLLRNDRCDMIFTGGFLPGSLILEIAAGTDIELFPIEQKTLNLLSEKYGFGQMLIPASTYDFLKEDLPSPEVAFVLIAGSSATDAEVYKMVRALHRQFDYYKSLHPNFANFSPTMLTDVGAYPMHPVAKAYYQEEKLLPGGN